MTSRPAAPESPETDALLMQHLSPRSKWFGLGRESYREAAVRQVGALIEHARSLERRLSLAQTEIKGHMRVEDELKAENAQFIRDRERANTNERHAASQVIEWSQIATEERHRADQAQVRIAELEKYDERYTWLVGRLFERSLHFQGIGSAIQLCAANGDVLGSGAGADAAIDGAILSSKNG